MKCNATVCTPVSILILSLLCLCAAPALAQDPVPDHVDAIVSGDQLTIRHLNAHYNCCQDTFVYTVEWDGDDLVVTEAEDPPGGYCDCICYFDLEVVIVDLRSGPLHVEFRYQGIVVPLDVVIGGQIQQGSPEIGSVLQSECHDGHSTVAERSTWGALRRRCR